MSAAQQATFRGVSFFVESRNLSGGRYQQVREHPFGAQVSHDDMGVKARRIELQGFLLATPSLSLEKQKEALIKACEVQGVGTLSIPGEPSRQVFVQSYSTTKASKGGNFCKITLEFVVQHTAIAQDAMPSKSAAVSHAASQVREKAQAECAQILERITSSQTVSSGSSSAAAQQQARLAAVNTDIAKEEIGSSVDRIAVLKNSFVGGVSYIRQKVAAVNAFSQEASGVLSGISQEIDALKREGAALINTPALFATRFDALVGSVYGLLGQTPSSRKEAVKAALATNIAGAPVAALAGLTLAGYQAQFLSRVDFTEQSEASVLIGVLDQRLKGLQYSLGKDTSDAVRALRVALLEFRTAVIDSLPAAKTSTIPQPTPSLALAFELEADRGSFFADNRRFDHLLVSGEVQWSA